MNKIDIPPALINVVVVVLPCQDGSGNAGDGRYNITTIPTVVKVTRPDTIINYQLIPPTPDTIKFVGVQTRAEGGVDQLGSAGVSLDGRMLTFVDQNDDQEALDVTLEFSDGEGGIFHDPQIQNTPEN